MTEVFLEKPESVPRVISLYCVDCEGVSQPVRADTMHFPSFGIKESRKTSFFSAILYYLPVLSASHDVD